ncbi:carbohydrate ABC transporter permease [Actinoplanes sp. NPDC026619]|uniref:carbohydrate ABC transporter permease n=1 Tax=Actinoplanes sp. NPDC026619 TaxID=3155798 RepID=UPI0033C11CF5
MRSRRFLVAVAEHSVLIGFAAIFTLPLLYLVLQSLMPMDQVKTAALWPRDFQWSNYREVFVRIPLLRYLGNTLLICLVSTIGTVVSTVPVAYAFAQLRWRGRGAVFALVLSTMMLPYQVTFMPQYEIFSKLGWIGTFLPLTVPSFFADAFSIFLLRQFFLTLPGDVLDAARIDGAGEWRLLLRMAAPMAKPAIMSVALFQFLFAWSDFFGPLLYLNDENHYTLAVGIQQFQSQAGKLGEGNLTLAACALFVLPIMVLFLFAQKAFIEGVNLSGVKG